MEEEPYIYYLQSVLITMSCLSHDIVINKVEQKYIHIGEENNFKQIQQVVVPVQDKHSSLYVTVCANSEGGTKEILKHEHIFTNACYTVRWTPGSVRENYIFSCLFVCQCAAGRNA